MSTINRIVFVYDSGGLCNRIFPFANLLAHCQKNRCLLVNPVFRPYRKYFLGTHPHYCLDLADRLPEAFIFPELTQRLWKSRFRLAQRFRQRQVITRRSNEMVDLQALGNCDLPGSTTWINALHALHHQAFMEHSDSLRTFFTPIPPILAAVNTHISRAREGIDILVGVHLRQGDYAQHSGGMLFYEAAEFRHLMHQMLLALSGQRVRFLVCSNVRQSLSAFEGIDVYLGPGTEIADLYSLARCDYIIAPVSTYSCWASFYGSVPLFLHNRKYEEKFGLPVKQLRLSEFRTLLYGYGRFMAPI